MTAKIILTSITIFLTIGCSSPKSKDKNWSSKMTQLSATYTELLPYVYSESEFNKNSNEKVVKSKINNFRQAIHSIPDQQARKLLGDDPLVLKSIQNLKLSISGSLTSFEKGNKDYARHLLKTSMNHCYRCHTRTSMGAPVKKWGEFELFNVKLNATEKIHFLIATRQFDAAKQFLINKIQIGASTATLPNNTFIKQYLLITIRVEDSPKETLKLIKTLKSMPSMSTSTEDKDLLASWTESTLRWQQHKKTAKFWTQKTAAAFFSKYHTELNSQLTSSYIDQLIASAILHAGLSNELNPYQKANAYLLLGILYKALYNVGYWELPEQYFERCIHQYPHSKTAQRCFKLFEQEVIFGYTGSSGTRIPYSESKRIEALKRKSE